MSLIRLIAGLGLVGLVVAASWAGVEVLVKETGNEAFCAGCHSMKPMAAAYRDDLHGGRNPGVPALPVSTAISRTTNL